MSGGYCLIPLYTWDRTIRGWCRVDPDIYEALRYYCWSIKGKPTHPYVQVYLPVGRRGQAGPRGRQVTLHRYVTGCVNGDGKWVDHINGNTLDNRRCNLHVGTASENQQNRHKVWGRSRFRGVKWDHTRRKWIVSVKPPGRSDKFLGYFDDEEEAGRVAAEFRALHMPHSSEARSLRGRS